MPDRAVVAISKDRQWLVALEPEPFPWGPDKGTVYWSVFRWQSEDMRWKYQDGDTRDFIKDTGQSADEVLREWTGEH